VKVLPLSIEASTVSTPRWDEDLRVEKNRLSARTSEKSKGGEMRNCSIDALVERTAWGGEFGRLVVVVKSSEPGFRF
jgi:hypothetical protein